MLLITWLQKYGISICWKVKANMISRLLTLASDLPAWDPDVQKIKTLEQRPEFLCICKAGVIGLSIRLKIVIMKNWQWPLKMFALLKSCHRLVLLLKLDDIHKFNSTELVRLTWIWHPGMSIQKLGFQSTLQLLEFIKAVITEPVVSGMIMHQTLAPRSPKPLGFYTCCFLSALTQKRQIPLSSFTGEKKKDLIKDC